MQVLQVKYWPGTNLAGRIRSKQYERPDLVLVQLWEGSTTDPANLAPEVERAERKLNTEIRVNGEFRSNRGYM